MKHLTKEQAEAALNLVVESYDVLEGTTIRGYFRLLLKALWGEGESFSGKRALGSSGWQWDVYKALFSAGLVPGSLDEWGDFIGHDWDKCDAIVSELIEACFE